MQFIAVDLLYASRLMPFKVDRRKSGRSSASSSDVLWKGKRMGDSGDRAQTERSG